MLRKKICFDIQMEYLTFVFLNDPFITFSCRLSQIFAIDCSYEYFCSVKVYNRKYLRI